MKKVVSSLFVVLLVAALGAACGKKQEGGAPSAGSAGGVAPSDKVGVVECDTYIDKLTTCLNAKVPDSAKGMIKSSMDQAVKSWKDLAATPAGKSGLATACKMAMDQSKAMVSAYGCDM
jgi:hypothetical protein